MKNSLADIDNMSDKNNDAAQQALSSATELEKISDDMNNITAFFKKSG